jgi:hypothetical protein
MADGSWRLTDHGPDDVITLSALGIAVPVADLYAPLLASGGPTRDALMRERHGVTHGVERAHQPPQAPPVVPMLTPTDRARRQRGFAIFNFICISGELGWTGSTVRQLRLNE